MKLALQMVQALMGPLLLAGAPVFLAACSSPAPRNPGVPVSRPATVPGRPETYLADICVALTRQWPENRTVNIVCHGHSVPAGYFRTPLVDTFNAYPHLLHRALKERFPFAVLNVTVTAIGGENSESGAARFERDVLALRPDVVILDYALNDRRVGLARAEAAWRSMITNATARGIRLLLATPTPDLAAKLEDPADPLVQHAQQVRRLAQECGVGLVDSLAAFQAAARSGQPLEALMSQGNHPNRRGHELVAAELLRWFPPPLSRDHQAAIATRLFGPCPGVRFLQHSRHANQLLASACVRGSPVGFDFHGQHGGAGAAQRSLCPMR